MPAQATLALRGTSARITVNGLVQADHVADVLQQFSDQLKHRRPIIITIDMRGALIAVAEEQAADMARLIAEVVPARVPMAMLAYAAAMPVLKRVAWELALRGVEVMAFDNPCECELTTRNRAQLEI